MSMLFKRIKDWATTITAFRTGDVIPVDGPSGTAKMSKDTLLQLTSQNALAGNVAPAFDPDHGGPNNDGNYPAGYSVIYLGKLYTFNVDHSGAWNASHVDATNITDYVNGLTRSVSTASDAINVTVPIKKGDTYELLVNSSHSGGQFSVFAFYGSGPSDYDELVSVTENVASERIAAKNYRLIRFYNAGRGYTAEGVVSVQGLTQDVDDLAESVNGKTEVNTSSNDVVDVTVGINAGDSFELLVTTSHSGNLFSVFAYYGSGPSDYEELAKVTENVPSEYIAGRDYIKIRFYKAGRGYVAECRVSVQGIQGVTRDVNGLYEIANGKTGITASSNDAVNVAVSIEEGDIFELLVSASHSDGIFSVFAFYGAGVNDYDELTSVTENITSKRIAAKNYRLIRFYNAGRGYSATCRVSVQGVTQNVDDLSEIVNGKIGTKTSSSDIVEVPVGIKAGDAFELLATTNHSGGQFSVFAFYGSGPSDYEELAKVTENVPSEYIAGRDYIKIRFYKAGRGYSATCNVSVFGVSHRASSMASVNILVIGDSFTRADHWVSECLSKLPEGSSVTSLAVISASVKDHYKDRTTYPYTSRPVSTDNTGNKNTFGCQIEKLKRLMMGIDLDAGEVQLYPNGTSPDIIIVEGGQNDTADTDMDNYSAQFVEKKENVYYKNNASSAIVQGDCWAKSDIENIDRTCFAGAYRYVCETLKQLFPSSVLMITTISNLNYWSKDVDIVANADKIATQQKWCASACGAPVIDWQKCQISTLTTYPGGIGTSDDPYILSGNGQSYSDSDDGMHPNSRGDLKLGYYMANEIVKNYYKKYLL